MGLLMNIVMMAASGAQGDEGGDSVAFLTDESDLLRACDLAAQRYPSFAANYSRSPRPTFWACRLYFAEQAWPPVVGESRVVL